MQVGFDNIGLAPNNQAPTPFDLVLALFVGQQGEIWDVSQAVARGEIFQDAARTIPAAVGQPVYSMRGQAAGTWADCPADVNRPILRRATAGHYYLDGTGINAVLSTTSAAAPTGDIVYLASAAYSVKSSMACAISNQSSVASPGTFRIEGSRSGTPNTWTSYYSDSGTGITLTSTPNINYTLARFSRLIGGQIQMRPQGATSSANPNGGAFATTQFSLMARLASSTNSIDGPQSTALFLYRTLTTAQEDLILDYLLGVSNFS